jgi:Cu(I)/Ag(I) efflux system membrane fusion protein
MMQLVDKYYDLKNALVVTNAAQADSAAMQLATIAGIFNRFAETDTANGKKLKPYADTILSQSRLLPAIKDESCEKQRITFDHISSALYGAIKAAGVKNAGIYHQFCPMAFNERGAYWLSKESEIKNPYFGKKMLECGEVTDSL